MIEVKKIEEEFVDGITRYEAKIPYTITDDFENEITMYKKETITTQGLQVIKDRLLTDIEAVDEKLQGIADCE